MIILNGNDVVRNIRFWKGTAVAWLSPPSDFAESVYSAFFFFFRFWRFTC